VPIARLRSFAGPAILSYMPGDRSMTVRERACRRVRHQAPRRFARRGGVSRQCGEPALIGHRKSSLPSVSTEPLQLPRRAWISGP
jgi:hypothetical protein